MIKYKKVIKTVQERTSLQCDICKKEYDIANVSDRFGPTDTLRFIQQYNSGNGDYTKERHEWLDQQSFEELTKSPKKRLGNFEPNKT